jgi:hypothetical protein
MKTAFWDSGLRWDDPNLRWGEPSYLLEPGDPGYVPDPTSASFPSSKPKRKSTMPKADFIKNRDAEFADQIILFRNNIGGYATALAVTAPQVTAQAADADYFAYTLAVQQVCTNCSEQWTAWKDLMRDGGDPGTAPATAVFPASVPPVAPGIERRFRDLVRQIKAHANYTPAIGEALGIEGPMQTGPDFATFKPVLNLRLTGGQPMVGWGWQGQGAFLDMIEIHVNRGSGYQLLAMDTTPDYLDTFAAPAGGAKWTYKAIYRVGDQRVGQWSDEASITVSA